MENKLLMSSSPHIRSDASTSKIMLDVLIALVPASLAGVYFFGLDAALTIIVCVVSCIVFEFLARKLLKRSNTVSDLSAAVTGVLLALNLPAAIPKWMAVVGSFFAIVVIKQLFGGIGQNFINPALGARVFMLVAYGTKMTQVSVPRGADATDAISAATPLGVLKEGGALPSYLDMFLGKIGGSLGETSALALILGGLYLLIRKVISWEIPAIYIGTVALLSWILGPEGFMTGDPLFHVLAGGLLIGAIFMATDYTTSPMTRKGAVIYAFGCGFLTVVFRLYTNLPEGVSYAILLMNTAVPLIDRYTAPKPFGGGKHV
ncbi:MAG TPA: RnfABCDGE type electron transport complex subunit D [Thermoclostridium caenicola]|uniref:Ion-translocating oxidoreductase complex subunit D n=1 Tax=Thermoclostridium caenicola TaxID=659425 RepID=A0A1M6BQZ4_9FIRM|nr:RnfABCDGE type electron transport complex subunit D [Thermoclostridium caenicola]SHI51014.1 electron transport complex protein RnfD [Thermoclostridium caenicola]HOK42342.1 RnfABCDGE type electron transport complex subunit D [Thermoclostridium caenicola]HOL84187.1 RnfABCDGE type electron transport complex subunit D [Thermoclostridium caenicola]HPO75955.1 RnfABCDGE type electron transport complex subunit D [Thermoclostridium caenicola]HPU22197.1 RnfABCDGE type electron transport complex subun